MRDVSTKLFRRISRRLRNGPEMRGRRHDARHLPTHRTRQRRPLRSEMLEKRELLAGDFFELLPAHNYLNRHDVNRDGQITVLDALVGINGLRGEEADAELIADDGDGMMYDVNGDRMHTALDSLQVLNAIDSGEQMTELVELKLSALTLDDQVLDIDGNGIIDIGTEINLNEVFKLEIAYEDLRAAGDDLGVFRLAADLGVSTGGILRPVLREAQRIKIGGEIRRASSGELAIQLEGGSQVETLTLDELGRASSPDQLFVDALVRLGYERDEIQGSRFVFGDDGGVGVEIRYVATEFGNVDMPDVMVTANFDIPVPIVFEEYSPFEDDGVTPNAEAVRYNLETNSRTFNNNSPFYASLNAGGYQLETGFDEITGVGLIPADGGGVPNLTDDGGFIQPFDALAVEVYLAEPIPQDTGFSVNVNPGESLESLLLYGSDEAISSDFVLLDRDAVVRFRDGDHPLPIFGLGPILVEFSETDAVASIDLLANTFADSGETLTVTELTITGDTSGLTIDGNVATIDPSAYESLESGETEEIRLTYQVSNGSDSVLQTATITIDGETINNAPKVDRSLSVSIAGDQSPVVIDLLGFASDPDGDDLQVRNFRPTTDNDAGGTLDLETNQLIFDPSVYPRVLEGEIVSVFYAYHVTDGIHTVFQNLKVEVVGVTESPTTTVAEPIRFELLEDDALTSVDLLFGSVGRSGQGLTTSGFELVSGNDRGIIYDEGNSRLDIFPGAYRYLGAGATEVVVFTYNVVDGGLSTAQTATITIRGVNDPPVATNEFRHMVQLTDELVQVDLLADFFGYGSDASKAVLTSTGGDVSGLVFTDRGFSIDPTRYAYLLEGQSAMVTLSYLIDDGTANSLQTARIEIVGNRLPGSTVFGNLFVDQIDNLGQLIDGAEPIRNGLRDTGEPGLVGLPVQLLAADGSGLSYQTVSDSTGRYTFDHVTAGTYTLVYEIPPSVMAAGSMTRTVSVSGEVGAMVHGGDVGATGIRGEMEHGDLSALTYIQAGIANSLSLGANGAFSGGTVVLSADGQQQYLVLEGGFEGARFVELALSDALDAALLSVIDADGTVKTALLSGERFVANSEGTLVQFFGSMEDFDFDSVIDESITRRFTHFRQSVDRAMSAIGIR